jgi:hypothetical protein
MQHNARGIYDFPKAQLAEIKGRIGEPGLHVLDYFWLHHATLQKRCFPTKEAFLANRILDAAADDYELKLLIGAAKRGDRLAYEATIKLAENLNEDGEQLPQLLQDFIIRDRNLVLAGWRPRSRRRVHILERDSVILSGMSILVNCYGYGQSSPVGRANKRSIEAAAGLVSNALTELEALGVSGVACGGEKVQKMWRSNCANSANRLRQPAKLSDFR